MLSILTFLGCDSKESVFEKIGNYFRPVKIENHLMQVKTGEGKSVLLGLLAVMLALMNNEVYEACYSEYLSTRDYEDFKDLFEAFKVADMIHYGTFGNIAETLINEKGNVRDYAVNYFSTKKQPVRARRPKGAKRILLVDEADTFFSKDFYGATYNPSAQLKSPAISAVIDCIWQHRDNPPATISQQYQATAAYQQLCTEYSDCMDRVKGQLEMMVKEVANIHSIEYVVQDGRIGYKDMDGISFDIVYGYKTMFQYLYESLPERGNVTNEQAAAKKCISLTCGQYSYAEMVEKFDLILGVSGTLECLGDY